MDDKPLPRPDDEPGNDPDHDTVSSDAEVVAAPSDAQAAIAEPAKRAARAPAASRKDADDDDDEEADDDALDGAAETDGDTEQPEELQEYESDDPLGPGFDLDGEPLDPQAAHLPWQTDVASPKEFFGTELLYRFDIVEPEERQQFDGTYRIELKGAQGGVWTVTVAEQLEVVNRKEDAEIVLSMSQKDFMSLVNGKLNPQLAILAQKVKLQGDVKKALLFQALLAPSYE
ncbi:MAG: SCP2 sterol-binding domain-containing protein [Bdellovibrionales bacterium]|nr:SCP2 sterol-binding domain-containing protein [Bdellovibrionales bacterium]